MPQIERWENLPERVRQHLIEIIAFHWSIRSP